MAEIPAGSGVRAAGPEHAGQGFATALVGRLGGKEVSARMRADLALAPGERMPFAFDMQKAVFFDPATERRIA